MSENNFYPVKLTQDILELSLLEKLEVSLFNFSNYVMRNKKEEDLCVTEKMFRDMFVVVAYDMRKNVRVIDVHFSGYDKVVQVFLITNDPDENLKINTLFKVEDEKVYYFVNCFLKVFDGYKKFKESLLNEKQQNEYKEEVEKLKYMFCRLIKETGVFEETVL